MEDQVLTAENEPCAVFIAPGQRGFKVALAAEDTGYDLRGFGQDFEERRYVQFDRRGNPMGLKSIQFDKMGRYDCFNEVVAKALRNHHKFGQDFEEISFDVLHHGVFRARLPDGGFTAEDNKAIKEMRGMIKATNMPPQGINGLNKRVHSLAGLCNVRNFELPREGAGLKTVQGRAEELVDLLIEVGILQSEEPEDDDGRGTA